MDAGTSSGILVVRLGLTLVLGKSKDYHVTGTRIAFVTIGQHHDDILCCSIFGGIRLVVSYSLAMVRTGENTCGTRFGRRTQSRNGIAQSIYHR